MKKTFQKTLLITLSIFLIGAFSLSQIRETGAVEGVVTDEQGSPLPGVAMSIESPNLIGGARSMVTSAAGKYRFPSLTVGIYKVTAELSGFNTIVKEQIKVYAGATLGVDFVMTVAKVKEEIIVIGDVPTIDIKSSKAGSVVLDDELLFALPTGKSFEWIMTYAPGVDFYSSYGSGYASPNTYQFDGVDVSNPFWGGIWFPMGYNVLAEANVQALGLPAEFGHFTGSVMTAVSKSGSNKLSTQIEIIYRGEGWNSQNIPKIPVEEFAYPSMAEDEYTTNPFYDLDGQVGGKIIEDKLWFFIAGQYNKETTDVIGTEVNRVAWTPRIFGKFTYQIDKSNKTNLSFNWYNDRQTGVIASALYPPEVDLENFMPGMMGTVSWTSIFSDKTFLDTKASFRWHQSSQIAAAGKDTPGFYDMGTGERWGNYTFWSDSDSYTYFASAHLSHFVPELIKGTHDFKFGTEYVRHKIVTGGGVPGGYYEYYFFGTPYTRYESGDYAWDQYANSLSFFAQDQWTVAKKLTLNLGARLDTYWFVIPTAGRGTVYKNWNVAPRIGLVYDILGDRKNLFKLHYAHYYETIQRNQFYSFENRSRAYNYYLWDAANNRWSLYLSSDGSLETTPISTQDGVSHPWIWEITGGYQRELFKDASLEINFYNRGIGKAFQIANVAAEYYPWTIINPGHDGIVGTSDDRGEMDVWALANPGVYEYELLNAKKGYPEWMYTDYKWYARGFTIFFNK
jgi:hypothetical protein